MHGHIVKLWDRRFSNRRRNQDLNVQDQELRPEDLLAETDTCFNV